MRHFIGYGQMSAADERFAANFGSTSGAEFVRDATRVSAGPEASQAITPWSHSLFIPGRVERRCVPVGRTINGRDFAPSRKHPQGYFSTD